MPIRMSEYVDFDVELDDFYRELEKEDKVWLVQELSKDPEMKEIAPTLTDLVVKFLDASLIEEQQFIKDRIAQLEWDFKNRNFV